MEDDSKSQNSFSAEVKQEPKDLVTSSNDLFVVLDSKLSLTAKQKEEIEQKVVNITYSDYKSEYGTRSRIVPHVRAGKFVVQFSGGDYRPFDLPKDSHIKIKTFDFANFHRDENHIGLLSLMRFLAELAEKINRNGRDELKLRVDETYKQIKNACDVATGMCELMEKGEERMFKTHVEFHPCDGHEVVESKKRSRICKEMWKEKVDLENSLPNLVQRSGKMGHFCSLNVKIVDVHVEPLESTDDYSFHETTMEKQLEKPWYSVFFDNGRLPYFKNVRTIAQLDMITLWNYKHPMFRLSNIDMVIKKYERDAAQLTSLSAPIPGRLLKSSGDFDE